MEGGAPEVISGFISGFRAHEALSGLHPNRNMPEMGGIWTSGAPWGPKQQKRPIIPTCLWHMLFCSAVRATTAYLSEHSKCEGGGAQPALHPVMQAASCRLHTQLTSIFYWAKNHHAHACASYRQVCQDALTLRSSPDRSKTLFDHLL